MNYDNAVKKILSSRLQPITHNIEVDFSNEKQVKVFISIMRKRYSFLEEDFKLFYNNGLDFLKKQKLPITIITMSRFFNFFINQYYAPLKLTTNDFKLEYIYYLAYQGPDVSCHEVPITVSDILNILPWFPGSGANHIKVVFEDCFIDLRREKVDELELNIK